MGKKVKVVCLNDGKKYNINAGTNLLGLMRTVKPKLKYKILGAIVNNQLHELDFEIYKPKHVRYIDISDPDGMRMYERSLSFILIKAFYERFPDAKLKICHSISKGLYCEIENLGGIIYESDVLKIKDRMKEIIQEDIPFIREEIETEEAIRIYKESGNDDKSVLLKNRNLLYTSVYHLDCQVDYFYGYLVPSTGYIENFDLIKYSEGMLLRLPKPNKPDELQDLVIQDKMFEIFKEHKAWAKLMEVDHVGKLNELMINKKIGDIMKISEALHSKKISDIADEISARKDTKLVLIAGPSSSGKTSTCKRLSIHLQVLGYKTLLISLDDYFVDRELTPRDANGEYDFECIEAIDVKLFNQNMIDLMAGKEVHMPKFDFTSGTKSFLEEPIKADSKTIFIVEGIHGLNPKLTSKIPAKQKFKVYVSALTQISLDNHNRISTTDNRMLRRMVRDYNYRSYSAYDTIKRWPSVRRGEDKHIFPFQEEADVFFNSALLYEFAVLKRRAMAILAYVPENVPEYSEAMRLKKFLSFFQELPEKYEREIPPTSILREFVGGSTFKY